MKKDHTTNQKGFALLYVMLAIASIVAAVSLASGLAGTFSGNRMRIYDGSAQVRMIAMRCAETLLMQIRNNASLTGSGTLSLLDGSCSYTISGSSPIKTITLTATRSNLYRRITITTSQMGPSILSTWTETN